MIWIENVELAGDDGGLYVLLCSSNRTLIRPPVTSIVPFRRQSLQDCDGWLVHCGVDTHTPYNLTSRSKNVQHSTVE